VIRRPLSYVALVIVLPLGTLLVLAALAVAYRGSDAALALLVVGLVGWAIMLVRNLRLLVTWARQPVGTPVPQAEGLWGRIFAEIGDRLPGIWDAADPGPALAQVLAAKLQEIDTRIAALQALRQTLAERVAADCPLQTRKM